MRRIMEAELMDGPAQALAYAQADFSAPHDHFIDLLARKCRLARAGQALDLGCGTADPGIRFAKRFPAWRLTAVDGAVPMLIHAAAALTRTGTSAQIRLLHARIDEHVVLQGQYDCVFSNSLLHHVPEARIFWESIRQYARGAWVFVMDLVRPASLKAAHALVQRYANGTAAILQQDFFHSLCAAYTSLEIAWQLREAGLQRLTQEIVSDRHIIIYGWLESRPTPP